MHILGDLLQLLQVFYSFVDFWLNIYFTDGEIQAWITVVFTFSHLEDHSIKFYGE